MFAMGAKSAREQLQALCVAREPCAVPSEKNASLGGVTDRAPLPLTDGAREGLERAFLAVLQRRHPAAAVRVYWDEPDAPRNVAPARVDDDSRQHAA